MPDTLFFSVVVPVHNKGPHVERAILSILAQTHRQFELLLIDDASTDDSLERIQRFHDKRIRVLRRSEPGPGGYAARNLGVCEAHGDWIAFLDADDEWMPDHLAKNAGIIAAEPLARFIGAGFVFRNSDGQESRVRCEPRETLFDRGTFAAVLNNMAFCVPTVVIRKGVLLEVGGFPEGKMRRGGDIDTWLRVLDLTGEVLFANHCGAVVHVDSVNRVTQSCVYTENEIRNEALREMIVRYKGDLRKKLKKFSNQGIVFAWEQNCRLRVKKNFCLINRLYFDIEPVKYMGLALISCFPAKISCKVFGFLIKFKSRRQ